ncbi:hypothetical protein [Methanobrevibacter sp.]|uniref:hypothetical protein n=1 Tax=Methanobrevibacter sp. TaxID=66852 RepID=UPI0038644F82
MSSRSATVLVIFIVAVLAFCFASVFASMTGPISILPNESESGGILDNLSAITDDSANSGDSYGYQQYDDYSSYDSSSDDSDDSDVETTTDSSKEKSSDVETTTDSSKDSRSSDVETTSDSSSSVETTTG